MLHSLLFTIGKTPQVNGILYSLNFLTVVNAVLSSLKCASPQTNKNIGLVFGSFFQTPTQVILMYFSSKSPGQTQTPTETQEGLHFTDKIKK